jgi:hypothetical protein
MSENNNDSEENSISSYVSLLGELAGNSGNDESTELDVDEELDFIVRPSAKDVADQAYNNLTDSANSSELPFDDPRPVIVESERQFSLIRDDLVEKIEEIKQKEEGSVSGAEIDTMLYLIDKNGGKTGKFTLFGGAESLIYNTAEKNGWNKYEAELVYEANRIAARENNLHRHLLLDTVVVIPNDLEIIG